MPADLFPGGIGVSHLRVYDTTAPDGLRGGTPHLHTVCTEAYAVIAGHGSVQTLSADGFASTPLSPGTFAWFTPGTVHRLINLDGALELFVLMQNSGLPEAGDMVCTFPADVLADPLVYEAAARLPPDGVDTSGSVDAALRRRDLAVTGFTGLKESGDLGGFHRRAAALVRDRVAGWRDIWDAGARRAAEATGAQLLDLAQGRFSHLDAAAVHHIQPPGDLRRYGCCGTLGVYVP